MFEDEKVRPLGASLFALRRVCDGALVWRCRVSTMDRYKEQQLAKTDGQLMNILRLVRGRATGLVQVALAMRGIADRWCCCAD